MDIYQIDAFTTDVFKGNPAAVIPLAEWYSDQWLQNIAAENNLSETAFLVKEGDGYRIRWFTPGVEVDLCGHATLATAWVMVNELGIETNPIVLQSKSGELRVSHASNTFTLDFPADVPVRCEPPDALFVGLGISAAEVYRATDVVVVLESESQVESLNPDFARIRQIDTRGIVVTAPGDNVDFVSRWFGPQSGVDEDPVTGSAHTMLMPLWANKLGKHRLTARQISARGGDLQCELQNDRVLITGTAVKYMQGSINPAVLEPTL